MQETNSVQLNNQPSREIPKEYLPEPDSNEAKIQSKMAEFMADRQNPIRLDGAEKNLSLLHPEGLLDRKFYRILPEQERANQANEALWLEDALRELQEFLASLEQKGETNGQGEPLRIEDQLKKANLELMIKLVRDKASNGNFCIPLGSGEKRAVLLTTPLRMVGEEFPDPTIWQREPGKQVEHQYYLLTADGIFCLNFGKTMADISYDNLPGVDTKRGEDLSRLAVNPLSTDEQKQKARKKLFTWLKKNQTITGTHSIDELYPEHSERTFARVIQAILYGNHDYPRLQSYQQMAEKNLREDELNSLVLGYRLNNNRQPNQDEITEMKKKIVITDQEIKQEALRIMRSDMNGQGLSWSDGRKDNPTTIRFDLGQFTFSKSEITRGDVQGLKKAIEASISNAQEPTVSNQPSQKEELLSATQSLLREFS